MKTFLNSLVKSEAETLQKEEPLFNVEVLENSDFENQLPSPPDSSPDSASDSPPVRPPESPPVRPPESPPVRPPESSSDSSSDSAPERVTSETGSSSSFESSSSDSGSKSETAESSIKESEDSLINKQLQPDYKIVKTNKTSLELEKELGEKSLEEEPTSFAPKSIMIVYDPKCRVYCVHEIVLWLKKKHPEIKLYISR